MIAVTTAQKPTEATRNTAETIGRTWHLPVYVRDGRSIERLVAQYGIATWIVVTDREVRCVCPPAPPMMWHPSMGLVRAKRVAAGGRDGLLTITGAVAGDVVIDATAGFCADAAVFALIGARVTAIEGSLPLAILATEATRSGQCDWKPYEQAMRSITVVHADHARWLAQQPDQSADIVSFDPMFHAPIVQSSAMDALRPFAITAPMEWETIDHARRIARKCVVIKQRADSRWLQSLQQLDRCMIHRFQRIAYAVIH